MLFTFPNISTLSAVLLEIKPSRRRISGCSPREILSGRYVAGRQPASAQSSPLGAALVSIKQMASAISSGLISRYNCVCGSTLVRMYSSPSARTIGVSVNPGWITLQRTP